jgi:glycosyltransferase involved in cell wall biosynthesis
MADPAASRATPAPVTCIVPVYNGERFLREAIASVVDQTPPVLEILVVDDGSTDGTPAILREFTGAVRVIRQEHGGVAAARNRGLGEVQGDFIAFQDADDLWMPRKLELQLARFRARPELDACIGLIQNFWMEELADEAARFQGRRFAEPIPGIHLVCLVAKRAVFAKVGPFDPGLRVGSDTDWFVRARDGGLVEECVPEVLVRRRLHAGNLTRADLASRDSLLTTMKASLDRRRGRADPRRAGVDLWGDGGAP